MAKALFGHVPVGGADRRLAAEVAVLRARVRDLETELAELRSTRPASAALDRPAVERDSRLDTGRRTRLAETASVG